MRKEASLDMWKTLYNLTDELKALEPWKDLSDLDFIGIQENGREEPVFVRIMGQNQDTKGIAMYDGTRGLGYLQQLIMVPELCMNVEYASFDQEALMLYFGERIQVPEEQMPIIKELGLKFAGKGNWPFFLSFKPRFTPWTPDAAEVRLMAETLVQLIEAVKALREERVKVKFDEGEFCFRYFDVDQLNWMTAPARLPLVDLQAETMEITDEALLQRLKEQPASDMNLLLDFVYMGGAMEDAEYDRPLNPLMFLVLDDKSGLMVHMDMVHPAQSETRLALQFLMAYTEQFGRPQSLTVRNPYVLAALKRTCEALGIPLTQANLPKLDTTADRIMSKFIEQM